MQPTRIKNLGHLLFCVDAGIIVSGLCNNLARIAVAAVNSIAPPHNSLLPALADLYPQLPTAWIPEISSSAFWLLLLLYSVWLICLAKRIGRLY